MYFIKYSSREVLIGSKEVFENVAYENEVFKSFKKFLIKFRFIVER